MTSVRKSSLVKRALDRDAILRRYQEHSNDNYDDIDLESTLSFSRFSQGLGIVRSQDDSPFVRRIQDTLHVDLADKQIGSTEPHAISPIRSQSAPVADHIRDHVETRPKSMREREPKREKEFHRNKLTKDLTKRDLITKRELINQQVKDHQKDHKNVKNHNSSKIKTTNGDWIHSTGKSPTEDEVSQYEKTATKSDFINYQNVNINQAAKSTNHMNQPHTKSNHNYQPYTANDSNLHNSNLYHNNQNSANYDPANYDSAPANYDSAPANYDPVPANYESSEKLNQASLHVPRAYLEKIDEALETSHANENEPPVGVSPVKTSGTPVVSSPMRVHKVRESRDLARGATTPSRRQASVKVSLTPAQRFEKRAGTRLHNALENFRFSSLVGKGAFASVYRGENLKTGQVVAIKQIALEEEQDVAELMGEIDLLKMLKHQHIVKYHGFVKTAALLNILLEYCLGGSLRQMYKRLGHGLGESATALYVALILKGLEYLHAQGVVHRDVKAANVLVTEDGVVKLADFGVATKVTAQHATVVGTPNWMAPETVLGGEGLCTASDIWSLGATIIELLTTHPPYHELNAMATLHAIGTDDHPPLPAGMSSVGKDFLMECFQKQPSLRRSAKLLLRHRWCEIEGEKDGKESGREENQKEIERDERKQIERPSERRQSEGKQENKRKQEMEEKQNHLRVEGEKLNERVVTAKFLKGELLGRFAEEDDPKDLDENDDVSFADDFEVGDAPLVPRSIVVNESPLLEIEMDDFDTHELEVQNKMEVLVSKFSTRVAHVAGSGEDVMTSLVPLTGRMLHMVKKYNALHAVLIKEHGVLSVLELLDWAPEYARFQKVWQHSLAILNTVFRDVVVFENFCVVGGIPAVTQFRHHAYGSAVRGEVGRFLSHFARSERALAMLVACGGLKVVAKFVEEDFETAPGLPLVSVEVIHAILLRDLARSKSDLCRILLKHGVVFWLVVLLHRLTCARGHVPIPSRDAEECVDWILSILHYFGQSETRVKLNISLADMFKLLMRVCGQLLTTRRLVVLRFLRAMLCVAGVLKLLHAAEIVEFLVVQLARHPPSLAHHAEVVSVVAPTLYNCCYLDHVREAEFVRLGGLPHLRALVCTKLPFRQFVLPIVCELVHCEEVRPALAKYDILGVYLDLLVDPYWQLNALDAIVSWFQHDAKNVNLTAPRAVSALRAGFVLRNVASVESALDSYLKLLAANAGIARVLGTDEVVDNILEKLTTYSSPVIQLTLLRVLKTMMAYRAVPARVLEVVRDLESRSGLVLVDEVAMEITEMERE